MKQLLHTNQRSEIPETGGFYQALCLLQPRYTGILGISFTNIYAKMEGRYNIEKEKKSS